MNESKTTNESKKQKWIKTEHDKAVQIHWDNLARIRDLDSKISKATRTIAFIQKSMDLLENTKTGRVTGVRRTPVPGGVGPMTVSMLLENTLISWIRTLEKNKQSSNNQQTTLNLS